MPIKLEGERYATEMLDKGSTIWFWTVQRLPQHPKVPEKSEFTNKALKGKDLSKTGGGGGGIGGRTWIPTNRCRGIVNYPEAGLLLGLLLAFSTYQAEKKHLAQRSGGPDFRKMKMLFFWIGAWWFEYLFVGVWEMEGAILRFQIDSYLEDHPS